MGKPVKETISLSNLLASGPELITPPPVYKIGFDDFFISSIASSISFSCPLYSTFVFFFIH